MADSTGSKFAMPVEPQPPEPQPPEMEVTDVAAEGDMILTLQHSRLRVSSVILASASPVFKVMLGPAFLEGQDFRSAQYPKEIPLEDDSTAMTRLCFLLHHRRDPKCSPPQDIPLVDSAEGLFALAVVADKYSCTDAVGMATGNPLAYYTYNSVSTGMPIGALLYLIGTTYILEDDRQFALFTRHLIMDHVTKLSKAAVHSAIDVLPQHFLLLAEEQRKTANMTLRDGVLPLANSLCTHYKCHVHLSRAFLAGLLKALGSPWPPRDGTSSLRAVLKKTGECGDVSIENKCVSVYGAHTSSVVVTGGRIRDLCNKASAVASGLCLTCVREARFSDAPCEHHELLKQCVNNDPIF